ncbi:hypothetical protein RHGRI_032493 [Rhododendron griersonianum]|uniref:Uncharacterized protein n=1 Tax=Rhododendron griersonianum TaxID=479676 RepID=A0AAV6IGW0_9ERIC|nr:hypothetical protein RHGRI_032493 [Rhododendron griersonianum]
MRSVQYPPSSSLGTERDSKDNHSLSLSLSLKPPRLNPAEYSEPIKEIYKGWNCIGTNKFDAFDIVKRRWKEAPSLWSPTVRSSSVSQKLQRHHYRYREKKVDKLFSLISNGTNVEVQMVNLHLSMALNGGVQYIGLTHVSEYRADVNPSSLLRICGYRRGLIRLDHEIGWASQHMTGNGLQQSLYKMVLAASLYHIWLERNNRVFQGFSRDALALMSVVKLDIRSCLSLWRRVKRSSKNQRLCALWNISQAVFSTV